MCPGAAGVPYCDHGICLIRKRIRAAEDLTLWLRLTNYGYTLRKRSRKMLFLICPAVDQMRNFRLLLV